MKGHESKTNISTQGDSIPEWKFEPKPAPMPNTVYHVAVNGKATGPYDMETLKQWAASGQFHTDSLVWKKGMENWEKAGNISELKSFFEDKPPVSPIEDTVIISEPIQSKTRVCKNCNTIITKNTIYCPECGTKNEEPFYKRKWFTLSIIIVPIFIIFLVTINSISSTKKYRENTFAWTDVELHECLPEPASNVGDIMINNNEEIYMDINVISKEEYNNYIDNCMSMGYTIDAENAGDNFTALNNENYKLSLRYYDFSDGRSTMNIKLEALEPLGTLIWPKSQIANLLPLPQSTVGRVSNDSADGCCIYIGETSIEDFKAYIDECMKKGFTVDYDRDDKNYHADDEYGNHLSLTYRGNNVMIIDIDESDYKNNDEETDTTDISTNENSNDTDNSTDTIRPKFKKAMDSYEAFINDYCELMKKYAESDGNDMELLVDYLDFIGKIADVTKDFEAWNNKDLNAAEAAYYLKVQTRTNKKLMKIKN